MQRYFHRKTFQLGLIKVCDMFVLFELPLKYHKRSQCIMSSTNWSSIKIVTCYYWTVGDTPWIINEIIILFQKLYVICNFNDVVIKCSLSTYALTTRAPKWSQYENTETAKNKVETILMHLLYATFCQCFMYFRLFTQ